LLGLTVLPTAAALTAGNTTFQERFRQISPGIDFQFHHYRKL